MDKHQQQKVEVYMNVGERTKHLQQKVTVFMNVGEGTKLRVQAYTIIGIGMTICNRRG